MKPFLRVLCFFVFVECAHVVIPKPKLVLQTTGQHVLERVSWWARKKPPDPDKNSMHLNVHKTAVYADKCIMLHKMRKTKCPGWISCLYVQVWSSCSTNWWYSVVFRRIATTVGNPSALHSVWYNIIEYCKTFNNQRNEAISAGAKITRSWNTHECQVFSLAFRLPWWNLSWMNEPRNWIHILLSSQIITLSWRAKSIHLLFNMLRTTCKPLLLDYIYESDDVRSCLWFRNI